jgi:hypothetical protein
LDTVKNLETVKSFWILLSRFVFQVELEVILGITLDWSKILVIYPLVLYFFLLKARSSNVVPGNTTVIK